MYSTSFLIYLHKTHNTVDTTNITNAKPNVMSNSLPMHDSTVSTISITFCVSFSTFAGSEVEPVKLRLVLSI
jgi:hypothetical protein